MLHFAATNFMACLRNFHSAMKFNSRAKPWAYLFNFLELEPVLMNADVMELLCMSDIFVAAFKHLVCCYLCVELLLLLWPEIRQQGILTTNPSHHTLLSIRKSICQPSLIRAACIKKDIFMSFYIDTVVETSHEVDLIRTSEPCQRWLFRSADKSAWSPI